MIVMELLMLKWYMSGQMTYLWLGGLWENLVENRSPTFGVLNEALNDQVGKASRWLKKRAHEVRIQNQGQIVLKLELFLLVPLNAGLAN